MHEMWDMNVNVCMSPQAGYQFHPNHSIDSQQFCSCKQFSHFLFATSSLHVLLVTASIYNSYEQYDDDFKTILHSKMIVACM